MENFIQILILSITQGITEFLPVSSSAHLNLISKYFGIQNELLINVYAHMGSLLAVIFFFKEDIFNFGKNNENATQKKWVRNDKNDNIKA